LACVSLAVLLTAFHSFSLVTDAESINFTYLLTLILISLYAARAQFQCSSMHSMMASQLSLPHI